MENTSITIGKRVIPLVIRRSERAKHISLRISPAKNSVIMTLPRRANVTAGIKFLTGMAEWRMMRGTEKAGRKGEAIGRGG